MKINFKILKFIYRAYSLWAKYALTLYLGSCFKELNYKQPLSWRPFLRTKRVGESANQRHLQVKWVVRCNQNTHREKRSSKLILFITKNYRRQHHSIDVK